MCHLWSLTNTCRPILGHVWPNTTAFRTASTVNDVPSLGTHTQGHSCANVSTLGMTAERYTYNISMEDGNTHNSIASPKIMLTLLTTPTHTAMKNTGTKRC